MQTIILFRVIEYGSRLVRLPFFRMIPIFSNLEYRYVFARKQSNSLFYYLFAQMTGRIDKFTILAYNSRKITPFASIRPSRFTLLKPLGILVFLHDKSWSISMTKRKIRTEYKKDVLTPTDPKIFTDLQDLLWDTYRSTTACCNILGISRNTWKKWTKGDTPEWPWWPTIFRIAIRNAITAYNPKYSRDSPIRAKHNSKPNKHLANIRQRLAQLSDDGTTELELHEIADRHTESMRHLRSLLIHGPLEWSRIRLAANNGGFSQRQLRRAATTLGVIKKTCGFGPDKDSIWTLPEVGED